MSCLKGLETLDLEKTHLVNVTTHKTYGIIDSYETEFYFKTEDGTVINVILRENKKASDIYIEFDQEGERTYGKKGKELTAILFRIKVHADKFLMILFGINLLNISIYVFD